VILMGNGILLTLSVLLNVLTCGILRNAFCKKEIRTQADLYAFNTVSSIVSAVSILLFGVFMKSVSFPSVYTLLLGIVFGLATALCAILNMKALECGPLSYTNIIVSCSMIIPAFSGLLFFGETVSPGQYIGAGLMIVSFICAVDKKNDTTGTSLGWFLLSLGTLIFSGSVGIMQKIHQTSEYKDELTGLLITAFLVSAVFSFALMLFHSKGASQAVTIFLSPRAKKSLIICIVTGAGFAFCNQANLYLSGAMEAIIFFPVVNGAAMLLTTAAGLLLWKEKLSRKQQLGTIAGAAAIFLLCGVFF